MHVVRVDEKSSMPKALNGPSSSLIVVQQNSVVTIDGPLLAGVRWRNPCRLPTELRSSGRETAGKLSESFVASGHNLYIRMTFVVFESLRKASGTMAL